MKSMSATTKSRRAPHRSAPRPASGIATTYASRYALMIQLARARSVPAADVGHDRRQGDGHDHELRAAEQHAEAGADERRPCRRRGGSSKLGALHAPRGAITRRTAVWSSPTPAARKRVGHDRVDSRRAATRSRYAAPGTDEDYRTRRASPGPRRRRRRRPPHQRRGTRWKECPHRQPERDGRRDAGHDGRHHREQ